MSDGEEKADASAWIAVAAGTIGSFMATLDTSIVTAALPTIQGEIGANSSQGSWVSTAYLVAEIIMIPLAGWLDRIFGLRTFLLGCTVLFTFFSVFSGLSSNLFEMVIGRIGQGFFGGAMIPTALTIVATRLPQSQRAIGVALFGATAVLGPVAGPLAGGWLTEHISWRYAFYVNIPFGIALIALLLVGLKSTKSKLSEFANADWPGILGLVLGLGAMTTVLEEGQQDRWFESNLIIGLCFLSAFGFILIAIGQLTSKQPVIRLSILFTRSFGSVFILSLVVGAALYGINYMIPQFLSTLADYNAEQSGQVTLISSIPCVMLMLLFPVLAKLIDARIAIGLGIFLYGVSCLMDTGLTTQSTGGSFVWSQIVAGFGQFFSLIFLNQVATNSVPQSLADDASGLFNAGRNLGGSIGLAIIATLRERRTTFHAERLSETVSNNAPASQDFVHQATSQLGMGDPIVGLQRAYETLDQVVQAAATTLAFTDMFFVLGVALLVSVPLVLFLNTIPVDAELGAA